MFDKRVIGGELQDKNSKTIEDALASKGLKQTTQNLLQNKPYSKERNRAQVFSKLSGDEESEKRRRWLGDAGSQQEAAIAVLGQGLNRIAKI